MTSGAGATLQEYYKLNYFLVKVVFARLLKLKYTVKVKMSCGGRM